MGPDLSMDPKNRDRPTVVPRLTHNLPFQFVLTKTIRRWTASTAAQQAKVTAVSGEPSLPWLYSGGTDDSEVKDPGATVCCCQSLPGAPLAPPCLGCCRSRTNTTVPAHTCHRCLLCGHTDSVSNQTRLTPHLSMYETVRYVLTSPPS